MAEQRKTRQTVGSAQLDKTLSNLLASRVVSVRTTDARNIKNQDLSDSDSTCYPSRVDSSASSLTDRSRGGRLLDGDYKTRGVEVVESACSGLHAVPRYIE